MADVLQKGESAMPKNSALKAPRELSGLIGPKPILDNRWGSKVGSGQGNSMKGGKK